MNPKENPERIKQLYSSVPDEIAFPNLKIILFFDTESKQYRCKDSDGNLYGLVKIKQK